MTRFEGKSFTIPVRDGGADYREGWDRIFGPPPPEPPVCKHFWSDGESARYRERGEDQDCCAICGEWWKGEWGA